MTRGDFGWEYPPGVTGNEPAIVGFDPDACAQCGDPLDPEERLEPCEDGGYFCSPPCSKRWLLDTTPDTVVRERLDAALELEQRVRVHRAACDPVEGVVLELGRRGVPDVLLEDAEGEEVCCLLGMIERVEVVEGGS